MTTIHSVKTLELQGCRCSASPSLRKGAQSNRSQRLDTALIMSQYSVRELIRRFEDYKRSEQELQHVDPHTGIELVKYNAAKPSMISI